MNGLVKANFLSIGNQRLISIGLAPVIFGQWIDLGPIHLLVI